MTYNWKQWEGQIVDGKIPLHQYLGSSEHDVVFLTEVPGQTGNRGAIKLIPAEFIDVEKQLASWQRSTSLSHPNLQQIYQSGRTQIDGKDVLYVVTDYADEDLSQILPERALTEVECTAMMEPLVDALSYVHKQGLVHGHISPANIMASGNIVKLSGEMLQFPGTRLLKSALPSEYDAPEVLSKGVSTASDVWSLGATLLEALTQEHPSWRPEDSRDPVLPALPKPLQGVIRNCLIVDPQQRWPVAQIANALRPAQGAGAAGLEVPVAGSVRPPAPRTTAEAQPAYISEKAPSRAATKSKRNPALLAIGLVLAALIAFFATRRSLSDRQLPVSVPSDSSSSAKARPDTDSPTPRPSTIPSSMKGSVAVRDIPDVPAKARRTIDGTVRVNIRVSVDPQGNVTSTALEKHGPSQYFAQIARKSASEWKFSAPQVDGKKAPSEWVLKYEFRRGGTSVTPVQEAP